MGSKDWKTVIFRRTCSVKNGKSIARWNFCTFLCKFITKVWKVLGENFDPLILFHWTSLCTSFHTFEIQVIFIMRNVQQNYFIWRVFTSFFPNLWDQLERNSLKKSAEGRFTILKIRLLKNWVRIFYHCSDLGWEEGRVLERTPSLGYSPEKRY